MQQRGCERGERHDAEQDEGDAGIEEIIERVGHIDVRVRDYGADGGENARDVRARQPRYSGEPLGAPRPFAGDDECDRQQRAQRDAHAGAEQPRLDRVAHQEDAAERQRDGADPDRPLGAEPFLQAHCRRGWPRRCGGFRRGRCGRLGRNGFVRSDRFRV